MSSRNTAENAHADARSVDGAGATEGHFNVPPHYDSRSCPTCLQAKFEEAARAALIWRQRYEDLSEALDEYWLWEPGRRGYAAARRELERVWRGVEDDGV